MLDFEPVANGTEECSEVMKLLRDSLPEKELFPQEELFGFYDFVDVDFECARYNNEIVGTYFVMSTEKIVFLLYLAVSEKYRSQGFGKEMINHMTKKFDLPIVINIEDSRDGNAVKTERKAFYVKSGFRDTGIAQKDPQGAFEVMCRGNFDVNEYERLLRHAKLTDYVLEKK